MHYVECGSPPESLEKIERYDSAGVPIWNPPREAYPEFITDLSREFNGICAYCEAKCDESNNRVDHFRPRAHFRSDMFKWENLMYVCQTCNDFKADKFPGRTDHTIGSFNLPVEARRHGRNYIPPSEYVNPRDGANRAETFFIFEPLGDIAPNPNLGDADWSKARRTILDFGLNTVGGIRKHQTPTLRRFQFYMVYMTHQIGLDVRPYLSRSSEFSSFIDHANRERWLDDPPSALRDRIEHELDNLRGNL